MGSTKMMLLVYNHIEKGRNCKKVHACSRLILRSVSWKRLEFFPLAKYLELARGSRSKGKGGRS